MSKTHRLDLEDEIDKLEEKLEGEDEDSGWLPF